VPIPDTLLDSLERFAATLTSGYGIGDGIGDAIGDVLCNLNEEMAEVLDPTGTGATFIHRRRRGVASLGRVQETWQKAPRIDVVASAGPVGVSEHSAEDANERWPDYVIAARTAGIQAVAGIPMIADGDATGWSTCMTAGGAARQPRSATSHRSSPVSPAATSPTPRRPSRLLG
jgi:hypothetical protein